MSPGAQATISKKMTVLSWLGRNGHFIVAVAILGAVAAAGAMLGWVVKSPVPWPEGVKVDEDFRLLSLASRFGPYAKVLADGVLRKPDGKPDGERIFDRTEIKALGLATRHHSDRYPRRRSNWYVSRVYANDRITDRNDPYKFWRLEVFYYTGLKGHVPHVPERCGQVAGGTLQSSKAIAFRAPAAREPWDQQIDYQRVHFEYGKPGGVPAQAVEYYVFSLNDTPERSWISVRLRMRLPVPRYNYFAKIQFGPMGVGGIDNVPEADQAAGEFIKYALPSIVKLLPTAADIDKLAKAEKPDS